MVSEKKRNNRRRARVTVAMVVALSVLLLAAGWFFLEVRLARSMGDASSADYDVRSIAMMEDNYYAVHHQYGTVPQVTQMENHTSFESDPSAGYHLQVRLISPSKYDIVAQPAPSFPFWIPRSWAAKYGNPVYYMDQAKKEHSAPYGTPIPPRGFTGKLPPPWDKPEYEGSG